MVKDRESAVTKKQLRRWERDGYLILENVLSTAETQKLLNAVDAVLESAGQAQIFSQHDTAPRRSAQAFKIAQAITLTSALDPLTDHPQIFPWLLTFIGPYLQILGTEIFVRLPGPAVEALVDWHTDGGPAMERFLPQPGNPILQMKVQIFLTDLTEPDSGNFMLVPGSHRTAFAGQKQFQPSSPAGATQIIARAGDAILFPWSLWHGVAPNQSGRVRKSVTLRYGPMWSRPYDYDRLPVDVLARMTPRRRRLFGHLGLEAYPHTYYYPDPAEQLGLMLDDGTDQ
jgi:ectoine hydroxylase-related dioxygenase (phytanoyl-CoA dioxygenase family)